MFPAVDAGLAEFDIANDVQEGTRIVTTGDGDNSFMMDTKFDDAMKDTNTAEMNMSLPTPNDFNFTMDQFIDLDGMTTDTAMDFGSLGLDLGSDFVWPSVEDNDTTTGAEPTTPNKAEPIIINDDETLFTDLLPTSTSTSVPTSALTTQVTTQQPTTT